MYRRIETNNQDNIIVQKYTIFFSTYFYIFYRPEKHAITHSTFLLNGLKKSDKYYRNPFFFSLFLALIERFCLKIKS